MSVKILFCFYPLYVNYNHGIALLSALCKQRGIKTDLYILDTPEQFLDYLKQRDFDYIAFSCVTEHDYYKCLPFIVEARIISMTRLTPILLGGVYIRRGTYIAAPVDYICRGEGETLPDFLLDGKDMLFQAKMLHHDLNSLPLPDYEMFKDIPFNRDIPWLKVNTPLNPLLLEGKEQKILPYYSSRGCPHRCLTGDTIIHTIDGDIPIEKLVDKNTKVLTRNPETHEPLYADAINIRKTRERTEIVRVHFNDNSFIDCTPDHRFMAFKAKNQFIEETEWEVEAKDLKPKQRVRAVYFEYKKNGRKLILTRRDIRIYNARLVYEAVVGRMLKADERIHHLDSDPSNDNPSNLELTNVNSHIKDHHKEISERMKRNNPVRKIPHEALVQNGLRNRGKKRSFESRLRYRESKLGNKNPRYNPLSPKHGFNKISRIQDLNVNHVVTFVEKLNIKKDVYCMEVPGINWFYANKVLVHNCSFCEVKDQTRMLRFRYKVKEDLSYLSEQYKPDLFFIGDELLPYYNLKWQASWGDYHHPFVAYIRADIPASQLIWLHEHGLTGCAFGIESGDEQFRNIVLNKGLLDADIYRTVELLNKLGINYAPYFMTGVPGETFSITAKTYKMKEEIGGYPFIFNYEPIWIPAKSVRE